MDENNLQQPLNTQEQPVQPVYEQPVQPVYGQPAQPVYQQPMQPPVPPVYSPIPPAEGVPGRKGKGGLIAVIVVIVLLLLAAVAVLAWKLLGGNPKDKLAKGFVNLRTEINTYASAMNNDLVGSEELSKNILENPYTVDASFDVTVPELESQIDTIGLDYSVNYDMSNQLMDAQMAVSVMNVDIAKLDLLASGNTLYAGLPGLLTNTYFVNLDTLGRDYNASVWTEGELDENLSVQLFEALNTGDAAGEGDSAFEEELQKLWETATVEDSGTAVEIERDGKKVVCNGVKLTLDGDACNELLDAVEEAVGQTESLNSLLYSEYELVDEDFARSSAADVYAIRVKGDVELYVYLDGKNRITNVATASKIKLENSKVEQISFSLVFSGSERVLDEVSGTVKLESAEDVVRVAVKRTAEQEADETRGNLKLTMTSESSAEEIVMTFADNWNAENQEFGLEISMEVAEESVGIVFAGSYDEVEKGKSFTIEIGELSLLSDDEVFVKMTGSISAEPFEGSIEMPEGAVDLFAMSEEDLEDASTELVMSLYSLLGMQ